MSSVRGRKGPARRRNGGIELEVLVEEESAERLLKAHLVQWIECEQVRIGVRRFQGKPDLVKHLESRLRGYAKRRAEGDDVRVAVLVDRDEDDCAQLKRKLDGIALRVGMSAKDGGQGRVVVNRIAVRELENWFYGDWSAVRAAYRRVPERAPALYRNNPDYANSKTSDALKRVLEHAGVTNMSKPDWAARIGPHMSVDRNLSPSFQQFIAGVKTLVGA